VRPELDPDIARFVTQMQAAWALHPPFATLPLPEARAIAEEVRRPWRTGGPVMVETTEHHVPVGEAGTLRVRVYDAGVACPAPALIYLQGGGFTLFSLDTHDRLMREYAAAGGFVVIGADHPLSPEARYPAALDAIVALVDWLGGKGAVIVGCDPARVAVGGDSAGANLALATALRLRDRGAPDRLQALLLNYGAFGARCSDEAEQRFGGPGSVLDRAEMEYYFDSYTGTEDRVLDDPYARPIIADLTGVPPCFLVIPDCDILSEQSHTIAKRMRVAGVEVLDIVYAGATHSFLEAMSIAELARRAIADGAAWLRTKIG
jgi:acetyl esterase